VNRRIPDSGELARSLCSKSAAAGPVDESTRARDARAGGNSGDAPGHAPDALPERPAAEWPPLEWTRALLRDLRFAARMLAKRPVFTLISVVTIGLGVGVNASVFSVVDALLLRPVPAADPHELVNFYTRGSGEMSYSTSAVTDIEYFRERSKSLEDLQAYTLTIVAFDHGVSRIPIGAHATPATLPRPGRTTAAGRRLLPAH